MSNVPNENAEFFPESRSEFKHIKNNQNHIDSITPPLLINNLNCDKCNKQFFTSWLFDNFNLTVCDSCRDTDEHNLITKTEAMREYLLNETDLSLREPPLKYLLKKNPRNSKWGEMRLFLQIQVEKRALEVWGNEENLRRELKKKKIRRRLNKDKKYRRKLNELRKGIRGGSYDFGKWKRHDHEYGDEIYDEESDSYRRVCGSCGFEEVYEKM